MFRTAPRRPRGFTLIELIVVVLVIGVLAAVTVIGYQHFSSTAKARAAQANLRTVATSTLATTALNPGTALTRAVVTESLEAATGRAVVHGLGAAQTELGFAEEWPDEAQYSVAFDGPDPDASGARAALLATGGGKTFAQIVSLSGPGQSGTVPAGTSPKALLEDPTLLDRESADQGGESSPATAPSDVVAQSVGDGQVEVTWSVPPGAESFTVTATTASGETLACHTDANLCVLTGAVPGAVYTIAVTASFADGQTATSEPVTFQVTPAAPQTPVLTVDDAAGTFTAEWVAPAGEVDEYVVGVRTDAGSWVPTTVGDTTVSGELAPGASVEVRVRAVAGELMSSWSAVATAQRAPAAPEVALSAQAARVQVSWPAVHGATSYRVDVRDGGGAWVNGTPTSSRSATVTGTHGQMLTVRVTALAGSKQSAPAQVTHSIPVFSPLELENEWVPYGGSFATPGFTRTTDDVVQLTGLIKDGATEAGTLVGVLPPGYRPSHPQVFAAVANSHTPARVDVYTDGRVVINGSPSMASPWISLSGIRFLPSDTKHTWVTLETRNGWQDYSQGGSYYPQAQVAVDDNGRAHLRGMLRAGTTTAGTLIVRMPEYGQSDENLAMAGLNGSSGVTGLTVRQGVAASSTTSSAFLSMQGMYFTGAKTSWVNVPMQGTWKRFGPNNPTLQAQKGSDGLVTLRGMVTGGDSGSVIGVLPAGYRPARTEIYAVTSDFGYGRVDIRADGTVYARGVGSWVSVDSITFRAVN